MLQNHETACSAGCGFQAGSLTRLFAQFRAGEWKILFNKTSLRGVNNGAACFRPFHAGLAQGRTAEGIEKSGLACACAAEKNHPEARHSLLVF
jgi:hypothetical protein